MTPHQLSKLAVAIGACALFVADAPALSATRSWTGAAGAPKAFNNPGNWSPMAVPSGSDFALFPITDTVLFTATTTTGEVNIFNSTITANESAANTIWAIGGAGGGFRVESGGTFKINGLDLWTPGMSVHDQGTLIINSGSEVRIQQGITTNIGINGNTVGAFGNIFVNSGGTLNALSATIGTQGGFGLGPYSNGQLIINGGVGSIDIVQLANVASGLSNAWMSVIGGGSMTQPSGSLSVASGAGAGVATLEISGAGSVFRHSGNGVLVGSDTSTGRVFVTNSGSFNIVNGGMTISKISAVAVDGGALASPGISVFGTLSLGSNGGTIIISPNQFIGVNSGGVFLAAGNYSLSPSTRLAIGIGRGTFGGGLNVGTGNSGTLTVSATGTLDANGLSTLGSGTLGNATATFLGTENFIGGLNIGAAGAAATIAVNGGTMNVDGSSGLTIGDSVGTAAAKLVVSGATSRVVMGNFAPVNVNRRGTFQLLSGGILNTTNLIIDGGTFDGSAGSLSILPFSFFNTTFTVKNNGSFKGTDLNLSPTSVQILSGGQAQLSGGLVINRGTMDISGTNSLIQAASASLVRSANSISGGGVASFGVTSLPFNPLGTASLNVNLGGKLQTGSLTIASKNTVSINGGIGSISGDVSNAGRLNLPAGTLLVSGATTNSNLIKISVGGSDTVYAELGSIDGTGSIIFDGSATIGFNHLKQASIDIQNHANLTTHLNGGNTGVSRVGTLNFGSSTLDSRWDLTDNDLIVDSNSSDSLKYMRELLISGRGEKGHWDGDGISSSAATADPSHLSLGYGDNALLNHSTFDGEPVGNTSMLIKYTWLGDANLDGVVNIRDLALFAQHFRQTGTVWTGGDFNYDGVTDAKDLGVLAVNWQAGTGSPLAPPLDAALSTLGLPGVTVPEPATLAAIAGLASLMLRRRQSPRASFTPR